MDQHTSDQANVELHKVKSPGGLEVTELIFGVHRPPVLDMATLEEFSHLLGIVENDDSCEALVIRSQWPGIFIAGADISLIRDIQTHEEGAEKAALGQEMLNRIEDLAIPSLALIQGACLGGGLELALSCEYRLVSDNSKVSLGLPETSLGVIPGFGGTYRTPRIMGLVAALPVMLGAKRLGYKQAAKSALADGLVNDAFGPQRALSFLDKGVKGGFKAALKRRRDIRRSQGIGSSAIGRGLALATARKQVLEKTGHLYPAPLDLLQLLSKTLGAKRRKALDMEKTVFGHLAASALSKTLTGLFFIQEDLKKRPVVKGDLSKLVQTGVVGAGTMGGGISWFFTKGGYPATMVDINDQAILGGYKAAEKIHKGAEGRRKQTSRETGLAMNLLLGTTDMGYLAGSQLVVEAVVEKVEIKKQVFAQLEDLLAPSAIIATNTSSLTLAQLGDQLAHPERFVGMHFFNPVHRMPLVEVVKGPKTSDEAVQTIASLVYKLGKTPIVVGDCPGFLVNRLLLPYLLEAVALAEEGRDPYWIDQLFEDFGMPMGPFRLLDEIGLDVAAKVAQYLKAGYGERIPIPEFLERDLDPDLLGKKTGLGFYHHLPGRKPVANKEFGKKVQGKNKPRDGHQGEDLILRPILAMVNEGARALEEGIVASSDELDMAMLMGTGFPPARGGPMAYAKSLGPDFVTERLTSFAKSRGLGFEPHPLIAKL